MRSAIALAAVSVFALTGCSAPAPEQEATHRLPLR